MQQNWQSLLDNPRLRPKEARKGGGAGEAETPGGQTKPAPPRSTTGEVSIGGKRFKLGQPLTRQEVVEFYRRLGWPESKISDHLTGIDFSKPVTVEVLPKGTIVQQWSKLKPGTVNEPLIGNYVTVPGTSANEVGVYSGNRVAVLLRANQDTFVLKSTAAGITDSWSVRGTAFPTTGGGPQYLTTRPTDFSTVR